MIDTCDPAIACWSDDGETFVIKDPVKFERTIIPQFFKHSKFSSFVRQLNFYSFRKIKYADTIRIDPKLEAETANYWRFRHERFRRGHPEWLSEIKRMNGQKNKSNSSNSKTNGNSSVATKTTLQEVQLQSEVTSLKKKMEEMTKNIDELTSMVNRVTLKQQEDTVKIQQQQQQIIEATSTSDLPHKKSRVDASIAPESAVSAPAPLLARQLADQQQQNLIAVPAGDTPPALPLPMDVDHAHSIALSTQHSSVPTAVPPPTPSSSAWTREASVSVESELSDEGFVDQLFTAFKTEDFDFGSDAGLDMDTIADTPSDSSPEADTALPPSNSVIVQAAPAPPKPDNIASSAHSSLSGTSSSSLSSINKPRPELMERLGDALGMLPQDIQELIVDRLIQSITGPKEVQQSLAESQVRGGGQAPTAVETRASTKHACNAGGTLSTSHHQVRRALSRSNSRTSDDGNRDTPGATLMPNMPMSLAAATLAALLAQYGNSPAMAAAAVAAAATNSHGGKSDASAGKKSGPSGPAKAHKSMPVISVHA